MVNLPARTLTLLVAASRWFFVDEGMRIGGRDVVEVSTMVSFLGMVQLPVLMLAMVRWGPWAWVHPLHVCGPRAGAHVDRWGLLVSSWSFL